MEGSALENVRGPISTSIRKDSERLPKAFDTLVGMTILASLGLGTVLLGVVFLVVSVVITLGVYYLVSGDYLWNRGPKSSGRNWSPPR